jgi:hypothetical protein
MPLPGGVAAEVACPALHLLGFCCGFVGVAPTGFNVAGIMRLCPGCSFSHCRGCHGAARSAVVAHLIIERDIVDHCFAIRMVYDARVHVAHGSIVGK